MWNCIPLYHNTAFSSSGGYIIILFHMISSILLIMFIIYWLVVPFPFYCWDKIFELKITTRLQKQMTFHSIRCRYWFFKLTQRQVVLTKKGIWCHRWTIIPSFPHNSLPFLYCKTMHKNQSHNFTFLHIDQCYQFILNNSCRLFCGHFLHSMSKFTGYWKYKQSFQVEGALSRHFF